MAALRKLNVGREARVAAAVRDIAARHLSLDDKPAGVLWIKSGGPGVSSLEVTPSMPPDDHADEPMEFLPSATFRFALSLHLARFQDFQKAMRRNPTFAAAVAEAEPVPAKNAVTDALQSYALRMSRKSRAVGVSKKSA